MRSSLLFALILSLPTLVFAKDGSTEIKRFVDGPLIVDVALEKPSRKIPICWARAEDNGSQGVFVSVSDVAGPTACFDKQDFFSSERAKRNRAVDAEVDGSTEERVQLDAKKPKEEWQLETLPTMFYNLFKKDLQDKGEWVSFCHMTFVKVSDGTDPKEVFCARRTPAPGNDKQLCPSPSECVKKQFSAKKAEKLVAEPAPVPHALKNETLSGEDASGNPRATDETVRPTSPDTH